MPPTAFDLTRPLRRTTSVVFSSPHSGRDYPRDMLDRTVLPPQHIRSSEDAYVDELFAAAPLMGAPLIASRIPRAYVDLNRSAEELDPALIRGVNRPVRNPRVSSGLGVIPRVVGGGRAIYSGKLELAEAQARIDRHWRPYHDALQGLLNESHALFGHAILIDCHSMPREALTSGPGGIRPDVVLGDKFGASATDAVVSQIEAGFQDEGFRVARNLPFAGAYIAQHYGRPSQGQHAIQIEIDRSLYLDEPSQRKSAGFLALRDRLSRVMARLVTITPGRRTDLAAE